MDGLLYFRYKEAPRMASIRFPNVQAHPTERVDVTHVTRAELPQLVPP